MRKWSLPIWRHFDSCNDSYMHTMCNEKIYTNVEQSFNLIIKPWTKGGVYSGVYLYSGVLSICTYIPVYILQRYFQGCIFVF